MTYGFLLAVTGLAVAHASKVAVDVNTKTGAYSLSVGGNTWFTSGATKYTTGGTTKSTADGTLSMSASSTGTGTDAVGAFTSTTIEWDSGAYVTSVRQYDEAVIFEQTFPKGVVGTSLSAANPMSVRNDVSTAFPTLIPANSEELGFLAFSGDMTGSNYVYGTFPAKNTTANAVSGSKVGHCRIPKNETTIHASNGGYDAWTRSPGGKNNYEYHPNNFCDCTGDGSCSEWVYESRLVDQDECESKCNDLNCDCFDFQTHSPTPGRGGGLPTGVTGFGPTGIFTKDMSKVAVISSFSNFMSASAGPLSNGTGTAYGLQASITEVPAGYTLSYIVSAANNGDGASAGVNEAFEAWGDKLLKTYGKSRDVTYKDFSLNYLGYSTDNGAFYYYQTEDHQPGKRGPPYTPGKNYEDTLLDVKAYADSEAIPYKYILLDSWWYYQDPATSGVTNWNGRPDIFPHGNDYLRNKTGWPIMGHNRFWAIENVYATANGGQYDFVIEEKSAAHPEFKNFAWPTEQRFWDDLMYNSSQWGLFMYEQDWLDTEYDNVVHLNTNATAGRTWLMQMGKAAERNDLTVQYCMSHCRHIMQSVELPAVTNARASGDYHPGADQWQPLATTGIFGWAVGIAGTKDNYWSTNHQAGSSYRDYETVGEPYNRLQAAISTLTKSAVAPSDKIGASDAALIMKSCAADGKLLQGDKPAMSLNSQHVRFAFGTTQAATAAATKAAMRQRSVYTVDGVFDAKATKAGMSSASTNNNNGAVISATSTTISGQKWSVVLGARVSSATDVDYAADLGLTGASKYVAYESNGTDTLTIGASKLTIASCPSKSDFQIYAVAPVLPNGWTLIGEQGKWVPVSAARFSDLSFSSSGPESEASVIATGPEGEAIAVSWLAPGKTSRTVVSCTIPQGSKVYVKVSTANPAGECIAV